MSQNKRSRKMKKGKSSKKNQPRNNFSNSNRVISDATYGSALILTKNIFASDSLVIPLKYVIPYQSLSNVGNPLASIRLTSNAYDVDAALGSTAMAGFAEYAAIYSRFRTLAMRYKFSFANQETFPVSCFSGFLTTSISSGSLGANYVENPYMHAIKVVGPLTGNGTTDQSGSIEIAKLFGTKQAVYDDLFTGSTTSSTLSSSATAYLYAGTACTTGTASGCIIQGEVVLLIQFYKRNSLVS